MKKFSGILLFLLLSLQTWALEGRWIVDGFISQTVIEDSIFTAEDERYPVISEIVFRTDKMAELFMRLDPNEKPEWRGVSYVVDDDIITMTVLGFGEIKMFWKKILPDRRLVSFCVYIGPEGLEAAGSKAEKEEKAREEAERNPLPGKRPQLALGKISEAGTEKSAAEKESAEAEHEIVIEQPEKPRQLLVFSAYFVLKK